MAQNPQLVYSFICGGLEMHPQDSGRYSATDINFAFVGAGSSAIYVVNGWEGLPLGEFRQRVELRAPDGELACATQPLDLRLSAYGYGVGYDLLKFHAKVSGHHEVVIYLNDEPVHRYTIHVGP